MIYQRLKSHVEPERRSPLWFALAIAASLGISACGNSSGVTDRSGAAAAIADATACSPAQQPGNGQHWIASWGTAPTDSLINIPLANQTVRQFVAPHAAGEVVRLRLSNRFGVSAVTLEDVSLGKQEIGANLLADQSCALTFNGERTVTIAPGETVISDPIQFSVRPFEKVGIDFFVPGVIDQVSRHLESREIYYRNSMGNSSGVTDGGGFSESAFNLANNWLFLEGLDVIAPRSSGVVVTFGDSITDGSGALDQTGTFCTCNDPIGTNEDTRYPDFLARRILQAGLPLSVSNAGISGNELLNDPRVPQFGIRGLDRYQTDILDVPGVTDAIIMIGTNDFGGNGTPSAQDLIEGYITLISDLQANGLNVLMGTIPDAGGFPNSALPNGIPAGTSMHGNAENAAKRAEVNDWIRNSGVPDGVVDFQACLEDPSNPGHMLPAFDSGDHLHPSPAGYAAMAECVDLSLLRGSPSSS